MDTKRPALIEQSGGPDTTEYALSGVQYNAMVQTVATLQERVAELETINDLQSHELNSAIWALTQCHLDMPNAWSRFLVEHNYRSQLPENVCIKLRQGLNPIAGGFPRAVK